MNSPEGRGTTPFEDLSLSQHTRLRDESDRQLRSSSPAIKRPASDMGAQDREDHTSDVDMDKASVLGSVSENDTSQSSTMETTPKAKQLDTGVRHQRRDSVDMLSQEAALKVPPQTAPSEDTASTRSDSFLPTPSNTSTTATSVNFTSSTTSIPQIPSIDDQVAKVKSLMLKPLQDKQRGFAVAAKWLVRVLARSSDGSAEAEKYDKSATEGDVGPVDNSNLVLVLDGAEEFEDEAGEPFVAIRPGLLLGEDFHILPQEAWDLVVQWYGIAQGSPAIIRYVHDTSTGDAENCQYELSPPLFSILKVPSNTNGFILHALHEKEKPPARIMASRHMPYNSWLRKAKLVVGIDINTKVRVWRILGGLKSSSGSGMITPAASRSASPAPGANIVATAGDRMVLDVNTFVALREGDERELLDAKDQTMNEKYNGSQSMALAGLSRDEVIVLEEQIGGPGGGEFPVEVAKAAGTHLSVSKSAAAAEKAKNKNAAASRQLSPAPGMMTRGRQRKDGKPRGITGLGNLGNTCYMNSALQCVRSVEELTQYFLHENYKKDLNPSNPLAHNGEVAKAYAALLHQLYSENPLTSFSPRVFKTTIGKYGPNFSGYGQQDSQEFLLFLLDGLQEDLNRIHKKPYIEKPDSTDEMVHNPAALKEMADRCWEIYKARNDSVITDLFAGMYKSTVNCPVCDKVSIIFDPFNNLTLQLPVENNWNKEIFYFPLHKRPIRVDVDIDKNSTIKSLKEFVARRMTSDPERMVIAEVYKSKFYKIFDNVQVIGEANIQAADDICVFELESKPTNYDANKPKRFNVSTMFSSHKDSAEPLPEVGSPGADRLLVPVFHRVVKPSSGRNPQRSFFGTPSYVIITREEAKDYDGVLRKLLGNVAALTTKNILDDDIIGSATINTPEEADTVVMNDDDLSSDSNQPQAASVESEDGLVDVSMKDDVETKAPTGDTTGPKLHDVLRPGSFIPPSLQNLFEIKVFKTSPPQAVPLGWNEIDESKDYHQIALRIPRLVPHRPVRDDNGAASAKGRRSSLSSDEDADPIPQIVNAPIEDDSDTDFNGQGKPASGSGSDSDGLPSSRTILHQSRNSSRRNSKQLKTYSRKGKKAVSKAPQREEAAALILPGEGIILDWNFDAHNALFEGTEGDEDEMRGAPTWKQTQLYRDEELVARRAQRQTRRRKGITLDDCLNEFGKMETLSESNAWYCPRCKEHRRANKKFELWKAPDILVMHLKRFSSNRNFRDKLEIFVDYPVEGLDLTDRVIMNEGNKSLVYDLIAVDNHYGGLGGGHYTAYAQNFFDKNWYEYNDSHVSRKTNPEAVVNNAAYLLFYRRRSDQPLGGPALEEIMTAANAPAPAESDTQPVSRDPSPSAAGEGQRLGGSSHNGSSSAFTVAGPVHRVGDGGSAQQQWPQGQEVSRGGESPGSMSAQGLENPDELPGYSATLPSGHQSMEQDMDEDEGIDTAYPPMVYGPEPPWSAGQSWSFHHLPSGAAPQSQMTAAPPASLDFNHDEDEDLFADADNDVASTKAEGGDGSSAGGMSDNGSMRDLSDGGEDFVEAPLISHVRGQRESAPPPLAEADEEEDLPVVELRVDDDEPKA